MTDKQANYIGGVLAIAVGCALIYAGHNLQIGEKQSNNQRVTTVEVRE